MTRQELRELLIKRRDENAKDQEIYEPKYGGKDHSGYETMMKYEVNFERSECFELGHDSLLEIVLDLHEALEFVLKQGIAHFDDCVSLTEFEGDDYCDCGAIKSENKSRQVLEKLYNEIGKGN